VSAPPAIWPVCHPVNSMFCGERADKPGVRCWVSGVCTLAPAPITQRPSPKSDRSAAGLAGRTTGRERRRFTFAELLVAMVFVAVVLPVAVRGVLIANRAGVVAEHRRAAVHLADQLLTELVVTGDWLTAESDGDFGEEWPAYRWHTDVSQWQEDNGVLYLVTVQVLFEIRGGLQAVELSTVAVAEDEET